MDTTHAVGGPTPFPRLREPDSTRRSSSVQTASQVICGAIRPIYALREAQLGQGIAEMGVEHRGAPEIYRTEPFFKGRSRHGLAEFSCHGTCERLESLKADHLNS